MIIFKESVSISKYLRAKQISGCKIGFVPTMGALHKGHISLIDKAKEKNDITVCSIFINPTQFNNADDFNKYPVTISNDLLQLAQAKCDVIFLPSVAEMYPNGLNSTPAYNLGNLEFILEGAHRPGHFQGVCQVVQRLLKIVQPNTLFLGQKDYQQTLVIKNMIASAGINVEVVISPTTRLPSGLAMSSRNLRLTEQQLEQASAIYKMLEYLKDNHTQQPEESIKFATDFLLKNGFETVDYVSILNIPQLTPVTSTKNSSEKMIAIAATIAGVRLIDNMIIY